MTQQDKELLLKDLCARLSYNVKGIISYDDTKTLFTVIGTYKNNLYLSDSEACHIEDFIPYLRPMSSMTEEERIEFRQLNGVIALSDIIVADYVGFDWLNAHHFDYRGLIEKELAIEVPKGVYENIK